MFDKLKDKLGIGYRVGMCYMVNIKKVYVPTDFMSTTVGKTKLNRKFKYYDENGDFESKIIVKKENGKFVLKDGFTSWIIAKTYRLKIVPVYIEE